MELAALIYGLVALGVALQIHERDTASWVTLISISLFWPILLGLVIADVGDKAITENWKRSGKARPR